MRRGLLPDYLEFEDAQGLQHVAPDSLMVMTCPPNLDQNIVIEMHPTSQPLAILTKNELIYHTEQTQKSPYREGEFDVIKAAFKNGILHYSLKRRYTDSENSFFIACTENVGCMKLLNDTLKTQIRITGNPNKVQTK